ncbi:MAG: NADH-quinone oxidoreductase subunit L [Bacteroidales bacterium]|nr:NADH-quinone oxidoreductase subunit L [Bacteroidales bacterium]
MHGYAYTVYILLIPFIIFIFLGLFGNRFKPMFSGIVGSAGLLVSFILSLTTAYRYFFASAPGEDGYTAIIAMNAVWLRLTETLHIDMGILLDPISVMMLIVITTVSLMVHIYSIGYMKGERGYERFFSFLSLFTFSMLGLVVAANIFQMYIFWELVGVSSYLLIGFYYQRPSAVAASKKAFIVTRFADLGFLIGILVLSFTTGTFDFQTLTDPAGPAVTHAGGATFLGLSVITWSLILVFMGGAGKSAMFPLHIWLPDAMEGPTPVSALIHAATMVVAGVYLVARMFPVYALAGIPALNVVAYVGGFTSLFAAVIACTQLDIKRVLAYSTMSQIGYMMLALGVARYGGHEGLGFMASMFHLFTHAMFKALLFLCAGAVIHAVHTNYMNEMGGLRKYLPITHITFLVACLTIAGIPTFAGFFSKDEILAAAWHHNKFLFFVEYIVAGLTAFYMFRLYFSIFQGKQAHYHHVPQEAPYVMTIPLMLLALVSVFSGFIPFHSLVTSDGLHLDTRIEWGVAIPSVLIAVAGIGVAAVMYRKESALPERMASTFRHLYTWSYHKFYIDEVYLFITKKVIFRYISTPVAWFDRHVVDGTINGIAWVIVSASQKVKGLQSGQLQQYALVFVSGAVLLILVFICLLY